MITIEKAKAFELKDQRECEICKSVLRISIDNYMFANVTVRQYSCGREFSMMKNPQDETKMLLESKECPCQSVQID